ncbi:hypothetical protein GWI33_018226 [Rhynchophorus ferrugineus]|uniref:Uncharacterized protein n=1 Tax=Rhynchophorus ferrugineus TaxID=354439 RepID=A0A834HYA8_RHYFE|nr:hypothetical protein GWI33_018226 [Rhynchophorus ferrugineus]
MPNESTGAHSSFNSAYSSSVRSVINGIRFEASPIIIISERLPARWWTTTKRTKTAAIGEPQCTGCVIVSDACRLPELVFTMGPIIY